jgi:arabinose-5-phosphate isomerase
VLAAARTVLKAEARALADTTAALDLAFPKAVELMLQAQGKVAVTGLGKSGLIGRKIASTLASTGTPSIFVHPVECLHGDLGMLSAGDVMLALSYSGETDEVCKLAALLKERGIRIISITGKKNSHLGRLADVALALNIAREACPYNITPSSSTTAMLALGDALALTLMQLNSFGKDDFARLHPGGSLGKILTLKVKDLMHTGERNSVVPDGITVKQALSVMTETRLGAVSVQDKKGKLCGFFTDGDLRRGLQSDAGLLARTIREVMTKNPFRVTPETPAIEAARIISRKRIDNIPVVDSAGRPIGIIDERDLIDVLPMAKDED